MSQDRMLPTYRRLFGELDPGPVDPARSVHSPAAYLAEMLDVVQAEIPAASLLAWWRRPDVAEIALGAPDTEAEQPYLDVVNRVLEFHLDQERPYERLRRMRFPFGTPFSLPHQRLHRHLRRLDVGPADLYRMFAAAPDPDVVARERLGLAPEEVDEITVARADDAALRLAYGLLDGEDVTALTDAPRLRRATGLTGVELRELVAAGPVVLTDDGARLQTAGPPEWNGWLDRTSRFVRLARRTGVTLPDLDRVLRDCCGGVLDAAALRTLAVVLDLADRLSLPIDVVCSLAAPMDTTPGVGLFDRTFNAGPPGLARATVRSAPSPEDGDLLAPDAREFRGRVAAAVGLGDADVGAVVSWFRAQHEGSGRPRPFDRGGIGAGPLSLLHRVGVLTTALDLRTTDLLTLLETLGHDPSEIAEPHRALDAGDPASALSLVRTLITATDRLRDSGLSVDDLAALVVGDDPAERDTVLADLAARRDQVAVAPGTFVSDRFGERAARVLYDVLRRRAGVLSSTGSGLLRLDPELVPAAVHDAVTDMAVVTAEDFLGLDLDERTTTLLQSGLLLHGYLDADGTVRPDAVPENGPVRPAGDVEAYRRPLFDLIRTVQADAGGEPAFLYPSDLARLGGAAGLPEPDETVRRELYAHLVFHGHLGPDGAVLDPALFTDPGGADRFAVAGGLDDLAGPVADLLRARLATSRAAGTPCRVTIDELRSLVDGLLAARTVAALEGRYLVQGTLRPDLWSRLAAPAGAVLPDLPPALSAAERAVVLERLRSVVADLRPFHLDPAAVAALGLTPQETDQVLTALVEKGDLERWMALPPARVAYFATADPAGFALPGADDYAGELFDLLNDVAQETRAAAGAVAEVLARTAGSQATELTSVLADAFTVRRETVGALCRATAGDVPQAVESLVAGVAEPEAPATYRRIRSFARLAASLRLDPADTAALYADRERFTPGGAAGLRIDDVFLAARYARLARTRPGRLAPLLDGGTAVEDPLARLAGLVGWDAEELRWLHHHDGATPGPGIAFVVRAADLFAALAPLRIAPSRLHEQVWCRAHGDRPDPDAATAGLLGLLADVRTPAELTALTDAVHGELAEACRDVLVPAVLATEHTPGPGPLYERLLVDVDMGARGTTSPVREAIAATQLYLHRYLLGLERSGSEDTGDDTGDAGAARRRVRRWWDWMGGYRTWEANRKVLLYPENYLRPELRDTRTPAFRRLESDLQQGGVTPASVQAAFKRYLDEYTEVSRLAIVGSYVRPADDSADGQELTLFGRTRTSPRRYFSRSATFHSAYRSSAVWTPWAPVDVQIDAETVRPVHAFGRLFVFWATVDRSESDRTGSEVTLTTDEPGDGTREVRGPAAEQVVTVRYSFRNLNQEWVPAQVLTTSGVSAYGLTDVSLAVRTATLAGRTVIVVGHSARTVETTYRRGSVSYPVEPPEGLTATVALTPELGVVRDPGLYAGASADVDVARILHPDERIAATDVLWFDASEDFTGGSWFSVDHKGGSFLCRPTFPALPTVPVGFRDSDDPTMPNWDDVDAAVELPDGSRIYFDNAGGRFVHLRARHREGTERKIASRWGHTVPLGPDGRPLVDGASLTRGGRLFVFTGSRYLRYSKELVDSARADGNRLYQPDPGYPMELADNVDGFPRWSALAAVLTGPSGADYLLSTTERQWVSSADLARVHPLDGSSRDAVPVADRALMVALIIGGETAEDQVGAIQVAAGRSPSASFRAGGQEFTLDVGRAWSEVDAGFVDTTGTWLYLTSGTEFARYTLVDGKAGPLADPQYPRPLPQGVAGLIHQGGRAYALADQSWAEVDGDGDPMPLGPFQATREDWPGMPAGVTGALDCRDALYLFVGNSYLRYPRTDWTGGPVETSTARHQIIRLTSGTAAKLNERLLTGGVGALLDTGTQETDELPAFSTATSDATTIRLLPELVGDDLPGSDHLDFGSANGLYYWEIFLHAPLLIAQALNGAQRFAEARTWFEYVFDPTRPDQYWRFLPFLGSDPAALAADLRDIRADWPAGAGALDQVITTLDGLVPAFQGTGTPADGVLDALATVPTPPDTPRDSRAGADVVEVLALVRGLKRQYELRDSHDAQIAAYRDDPFDPHTVAALRPTAYRRAVVMAYVDNLIDWGDLLFRQYTAETVDEARMLYVLARDLLGPPPEFTRPAALPPVTGWTGLAGSGGPAKALEALLGAAGHGPRSSSYFAVPANPALVGYWDLVTDRLGKIRRSLDIMGIGRPLPQFGPPIDPAALVAGVAAGGGAGAATSATVAAVPHHRFAVVLARAQELAERVRGFGQDLLGAIDRRESEELELLRNRQEAQILALTRAARQAQVGMAEAGLRSAQASRDAAVARVAHYDGLIAAGPSATQEARLDVMKTASALHMAAAGLKIGAAIAHAVPETTLGPFSLGVEVGGRELGAVISDAADVAESTGEGLSMVGEVLGIVIEQEQALEDWRYQARVARHDVAQMEPEVTAAELALTAARRELDVLDVQMAQQAEVATFLRDRFTGAELYAWSAGRLGALYFRAYGLAEETAHAAERAFRFERGLPENGTPYITPGYWDDRRRGLLAGESLCLDLDRLANAARDSHRRGLEITRQVSLRAVDPLALLRLRAEGTCEITLSEEMFDRDFPGHYRRQVRSVAVTFTDADGAVITPNGTLTQLTHRTVLDPDPKAVRHLLTPKGDPPPTLRVDWRSDQQIALSEVPDGTENTGLHDLRYDDERYLPFEGTGAVGSWRLELTGRRPSAGLPDDVVLTLRYTAENGGAVFAAAVRGLLKPTPAARYIDVAAEFPDEWEGFVDDPTGPLVLPLAPADLPGIVGRQVTGLHMSLVPDGTVAGGSGLRLLVGGDRNLAVVDGRLLPTPGLTLPADGSGLTLVPDGGADATGLRTVVLVLAYRDDVSAA